MNEGVEAGRRPLRDQVVSPVEGLGAIRKPHLPDLRGPQDGSSPYLSVVVPAYNEEARLGKSLPAIYEYLERTYPSFELIVVDDGSSDGTARVVQDFASGRPGVELVSYRPNRGKGNAVRAGVMRARGDLVLFSDADLATPIEEVELLLDRLTPEARVAIGSRAVKGSKLVERQPWYRELAGRTLNLMVQVMAVPGVRDTQCGFKLFPRDVARDLFGRVAEEGFSFDIEVLHLAQRLGYGIAEVPVRWSHQEGSKVRLLRDSCRMFVALTRVRRRHRGPRSPVHEASRV
jgi:dolichyl-phosphate beta-glucosyltransferase